MPKICIKILILAFSTMSLSFAKTYYFSYSELGKNYHTFTNVECNSGNGNFCRMETLSILNHKGTCYSMGGTSSFYEGDDDYYKVTFNSIEKKFLVFKNVKYGPKKGTEKLMYIFEDEKITTTDPRGKSDKVMSTKKSKGPIAVGCNSLDFLSVEEFDKVSREIRSKRRK